jgi:hypothetical protein
MWLAPDPPYPACFDQFGTSPLYGACFMPNDSNQLSFELWFKKVLMPVFLSMKLFTKIIHNTTLFLLVKGLVTAKKNLLKCFT